MKAESEVSLPLSHIAFWGYMLGVEKIILPTPWLSELPFTDLNIILAQKRMAHP